MVKGRRTSMDDAFKRVHRTYIMEPQSLERLDRLREHLKLDSLSAAVNHAIAVTYDLEFRDA